MSLDERLFAAINGDLLSPALDWWSAMVRASDLWVIPACLTAVLVIALGGPKARSTGLLAFIVFVLGDGLIVKTAKQAFQRPPPKDVLAIRTVRLARTEPRIRALWLPLEIEQQQPHAMSHRPRSFPSGHAWNAFAVATILALSYRRWGWIALLVAISISYTRVYAGLHWPSDVVISGLMSIPVTWGLTLFLDAGWSRIRPRLLSRWKWAREVHSLLPWRRFGAAP